jgi:hypothetical protein
MTVRRGGAIAETGRPLRGRSDEVQSAFSDGTDSITYDLEGKPMEEDIFCVVSQVVTRTGSRLSAQENIFWTAEALYAFRASAGHLDAVGQACMASVKSFKINPQWLQACRAESQRILNERAMFAKMMSQMAANQRRSLQRLGDLSRSISDASDSIMDGYFERSAAYDRMGEKYSEAIRGVDSYIDPTSDYSPQLPGGYDHAWGNGLGEYIVSNDHLFNPNRITMNWQWSDGIETAGRAGCRVSASRQRTAQRWRRHEWNIVSGDRHGLFDKIRGEFIDIISDRSSNGDRLPLP